MKQNKSNIKTTGKVREQINPRTTAIAKRDPLSFSRVSCIVSIQIIGQDMKYGFDLDFDREDLLMILNLDKMGNKNLIGSTNGHKALQATLDNNLSNWVDHFTRS